MEKFYIVPAEFFRSSIISWFRKVKFKIGRYVTSSTLVLTLNVKVTKFFKVNSGSFPIASFNGHSAISASST